MKCESPLANRAILYSDTINGKIVGRDDLWAVPSSELNDNYAELSKIQKQLQESQAACAEMRNGLINITGFAKPEDSAEQCIEIAERVLKSNAGQKFLEEREQMKQKLEKADKLAEVLEEIIKHFYVERYENQAEKALKEYREGK